MDEEKDVGGILDEPIPITPETPTGEQPAVTPTANIDVQEPKPEDKPKEQYVPLSRFQEVNQEMKELREQNIRMQTLIEERLRPPAPASEPEDDMLDPAVKKIKQENLQLKQALGGLADKQDLFDARYSIKDYEKHSPKVDVFRKEMANRGQWVSRTDAFYYLQGKELLDKPQTVKPQVELVQPAPEVRPEPIPKATPAAQNLTVKKPLTLEEERAKLGHVEF